MADENVTASENTTETNEPRRLRSVLQPPPDSPKPISRPPKRSAVSPMTAPCS